MDKKRRAGEKAVEWVQDGMIVGLGTGSTAYWAVRCIGELVQRGMSIRGIPTSERTKALAMELSIPLISLGDCDHVDVTIDGADEIDPAFQLIKGGGGALFREKRVARSSRRLIIVADESKWVPKLGAVRLPVEIVPFGWQATVAEVERLGCRANLREANGHPFVTDNGNWIADCTFGAISQPGVLHQSLKMITGVVETGLFVDLAHVVILGTDSGVHVLTS